MESSWAFNRSYGRGGDYQDLIFNVRSPEHVDDIMRASSCALEFPPLSVTQAGPTARGVTLVAKHQNAASLRLHNSTTTAPRLTRFKR